jgi:putative ABC transport system ATP-binding protein
LLDSSRCGVRYRAPAAALSIASVGAVLILDIMSSNEPGVQMIQLRDVTKRYPGEGGGFSALQGIDLRIGAGDFVAVVGKSGSGKSTLLNLVAGIDRPTEGEVRVAATRLADLDESRLAAWRGRNIGVVFQFFQLLPTLTVLENVTLPMDLCSSRPPRAARARAMELLEQVGIADQAGKLPSGLSGGQQQRAAIARALANDAPVLVADEPTGNLDSRTASAVLDLLADTAGKGRTVLMVTHELDVAEIVDRVVTLADGRILSDVRRGRGGAEVSHG